jgi:hypothetical protein
MQNIAGLLSKIAEFSLKNKGKFEALVKQSLAMQQTDDMKKQQKRLPQITARMGQIDKVINQLYEDKALGSIDLDRYEQLTKKYSEEYYSLKKELEETQEHLSDQETASQRAKKFIKMVEKYCAFSEITPTAINEFISKLVVHERDVKGSRHAVQHVEVHFNYIGTFENEITAAVIPTEEELERMRAEQAQAKLEHDRAWRRNWNKEYRTKNLEKLREYDRMKAREYRAKRKLEQSAQQPAAEQAAI